MWALGIGMGVTSIGLSLYYRTPILTAWSTPGAALLVASLSGIPMGEAIGAFLFSALLITLCGLTGWFERVMHHIPMPFAAAMLAGILLRFGMDVFVAMQSDLSLVLLMFIGYLIALPAFFDQIFFFGLSKDIVTIQVSTIVLVLSPAGVVLVLVIETPRRDDYEHEHENSDFTMTLWNT